MVKELLYTKIRVNSAEVLECDAINILRKCDGKKRSSSDNHDLY
jgi:phage tail tube protein FII